jgi:hypothetical protein
MEGRMEGLAEAVLRLLVQRGLVPRPEQRARMLAERDLATVESWLVRAVTCTSVDELF